MSSVKLLYTLPTQRSGGKPLAVSEIAYVEVFLSADQGQNFVSVAQVPPTVTEFTQTELEAGTYHFQFVVVDKQNPVKKSPAVPAQASISAPAPLGVTNVQVVVIE